jgi:hypothetical protein
MPVFFDGGTLCLEVAYCRIKGSLCRFRVQFAPNSHHSLDDFRPAFHCSPEKAFNVYGLSNSPRRLDLLQLVTHFSSCSKVLIFFMLFFPALFFGVIAVCSRP